MTIIQQVRAWVSGHRRSAITVLVVAVIAGSFGLYWFQPWKIFTSSTVDEAVPVAAGSAAATGLASGESADVMAQAMTASAASPEAMSPEAMNPSSPEVVADTLPGSSTASPTTSAAPAPVAPAEPVVLAQGAFVDGEHATSGSASILQLADGSRYLRLEDFSTSDGPDVHVWLTDQAAGGAWGSFDDGRYVQLGELKATDGNQNYLIPADADVSGFQSAVIWCDRFSVAFGSAALSL